MLSARRLFAIKCSTGALEAVFLTTGYTLILSQFVLAVDSLEVSPVRLVFEGIAWGVTLSPLGAALGFLFPDLRGKGLFLKGASSLSKVVFTSASGISGAFYFLGVWLVATGVAGDGARWVGILLAAVTPIALSSVLIPIALRSHAGRVV
jgi:hypothetical protein